MQWPGFLQVSRPLRTDLENVMADLPVFRPPGSSGPDIEPMSADGYRAAIADCFALAVAQDMIPPSWRIEGGQLTVLDTDGRLDLVDKLARDDRVLDWRLYWRLEPELSACVRWLRALRGFEERMDRGDGLLTALRARMGPEAAQDAPAPPGRGNYPQGSHGAYRNKPTRPNKIQRQKARRLAEQATAEVGQ